MKLPELEDVIELAQEGANLGWCVYCGDWTHDSCEPDARGYTCPDCNKRGCFGIEEVMML